MLAFGQIVLPIAALIAVGLLFVGIKLFFLTPPDRGGVEVVAGSGSAWTANPEPEEGVAEKPGDAAYAVEPPKPADTKPQTQQKVVLAGPVDPANQPAKTAAKPAEVNRQTVKPAAKQTAAAPAKPAVTQTADKSKAAAATPVPAQTKWAVQIGAFTKEEGAKTLSAQAKKDGYTTSVSTTNTSSGSKFYRVRVNAGDTREKAEQLAAELEKKGYPVSVTPIQ